MKNKGASFYISYGIYIYLLVYLIINAFFLVDFPFVHSDEPWLSGLSRAMLESKSFGVTEPFFNSFKRNPHGIKLVFHSFQIVFMKVFGYKIFTFRLISLIFSIGSLYVFYGLSKILFSSHKIALLSTIILSLDNHFIYSSHLARQEIIILFFILLSSYYLYAGLARHTYFRDIIIGIFVGISIGIHPNSFIVAMTIGGIYVFLLIRGRLSYKNLLVLITIVSVFALIFIAISFSMDSNFLSNYRESGKQFGVEKSLNEKFFKLKDFYKNLYEGKSVSYYIPNIRFQLLMAVAFFILSLVSFIKDRENIRIQAITIGLLFINLGIILIGRYNVTSIIFIFPFVYILLVYVLCQIQWGKYNILIGFLLLITLFHSSSNISLYNNSYKNYSNNFSGHVDREARVLSNLNSEYYFNNGKLLDYRNLYHNQALRISFEDYIRSNDIEYIIYYDELDYIYEKTPIYNGVYGDVSKYYDEMKTFLDNHCDFIYSFISSTYGTNIVRLVDNRNWKVHIYRVVGTH